MILFNNICIVVVLFWVINDDIINYLRYDGSEELVKIKYIDINFDILCSLLVMDMLLIFLVVVRIVGFGMSDKW